MRATGDEAIAAFCTYQRQRNLSPTTIKTRRLRLLALGRFVEPKDLLAASTHDMDRWISKLNPPLGPSARTRYNYIGHLAAFYTWALRRRYVKVDPTEDLVRPKLPKLLPRPWDPAEVAGAIMVADDRMRCFLLLAWFAGARCMEMAALGVEDIHVAHRSEDDSFVGSLLLHGKGAKERVVPLHREVLRALHAYGLPRAGFVFRRKDGWPLKPATISCYVSRYLHSVGVDATAHQGRHRYGTDLYELSDGDLLMVADLMGHSSPATTMGYAQWAKTRANEVVGQLKLPDAVS